MVWTILTWVVLIAFVVVILLSFKLSDVTTLTYVAIAMSLLLLTIELVLWLDIIQDEKFLIYSIITVVVTTILIFVALKKDNIGRSTRVHNTRERVPKGTNRPPKTGGHRGYRK